MKDEKLIFSKAKVIYRISAMLHKMLGRIVLYVSGWLLR